MYWAFLTNERTDTQTKSTTLTSFLADSFIKQLTNEITECLNHQHSEDSTGYELIHIHLNIKMYVNRLTNQPLSR